MAGLVLAAGGVAVPAGAAEIDDDVILGALVAEFHIGVAGSLLPDASAVSDAALSEDAIAGAAQLIQLTGIAEQPADAGETDLGKALDAFLAFAATLDKAKKAPLAPKLARALACQLIGADPVAHAALGSILEIDAAAAARCTEAAHKSAAEWNKRFAPYRRGPGLTPPAGAGPLYVEIAPVIDEANEAIAEALRRNGLYDSLAERLNAELALPYGRLLLVTECGGPNSFFNPDRREIVLCDERIAAWIAAQG
ncbi:DUF4344 domain-containing metallopeptidase [Dongia sp.]|uniref:DUF4344 domain-containing metallopeptidase n=1 Tax=Dongia sp. TaxID=1977262 RepID=UPI0035B03506